MRRGKEKARHAMWSGRYLKPEKRETALGLSFATQNPAEAFSG